MIDKINIRPITKNDYSFGFFVMQETLKEYIEKTWGWNKKIQKNYYRQNFSLKDQYIIELDTIKIGWLKYAENIEKIEIDKIFLLPKYQNKGIGSEIITNLITLGKSKKLSIELQVLKINIKARKFYKKLGFMEYKKTDTHIKMKLG